MLTFSNISNDIGHKMDSNIFCLDLKLYYIDLSSRFINKHIFKNIVFLTASGIIQSIEEDLFKSFQYLGFLHLKVQNIQKLFKIRNKWLQYLNYDFKEGSSRVFALFLDQTHANVTFYNFPDQDFCYFKDFPHHKLVLPIIRPIMSLDFTCSHIFLIQYSVKNSEQLFNFMINRKPDTQYTELYYQHSMDKYIDNVEMNQYCLDVIQQTLPICNVTSSLAVEETNFYLYDWRMIINFSQIIFSVFINSSLCIICFILEFYIRILF